MVQSPWVAHEYSHIALEHTGPLVSHATLLGPLHDIAEWSQQQELEADALAVSLQLATADLTGNEAGRLDANLRIAGVVLFFACNLLNDAISHGIKGCSLEAEPHASHPTALARLKHASKCIERIPDEFKIVADTAFSWAMTLSVLVAKTFHNRHRLSNDNLPYLTGEYFPFQQPA